MAFTDFRDLIAYKKAFEQADSIFEMSFLFPKEEKYSHTDQIRRSSRSVCANLAEAYSKRIYPKHFHLKMTDCLGENKETMVWIDFSYKCNYINEEIYRKIYDLNREVSKLLMYMINNPNKFGVNDEK